MTLKEFRKLSSDAQHSLITQIKNKYINELKNHEKIAKELDIGETAIRKILEENNIKRSEEQVIAARKKYKLEKYGDENYCNSEKIKESLRKNTFNHGEHSQQVIANKVLKEQGLYSWIILDDTQKEYFKNKIIEMLDNAYYDEEICEELKLTKGCYNRIKKEYDIKRSNKLQHEIITRRLNDKYGVKNVYQLESVKQKIKQNNLEKHGVEHNWQRADVKEKIRATKIEKYGDEKYRNDEQIKLTCQEKYGADNPFASNIIKEIIQEKNLEKFGSISPFGNKDVQLKSKQTKLEKYGDENYHNDTKAKETKIKKYGSLQNTDKIRNTTLEKYGVEWPCQLPQCINKSNSVSKINMMFSELLKINNISFIQEFNLENKKFDFKIGSILIEINPTYTHNSSIGCGFNGHYENPLSKYYHLEKSKLAQKHGFHCIHVWDWDDWNKIINLLIPKQKIYARKCEIREVDKQECDNFLNNYHLQNTCNRQLVRLGLYYDNELIQIMTFGKPRYNKNYEYELLRLCSHKDYQVIGGSQRLWNHFLKNYKPANIISYCDNSKFTGRVYETIGMVLRYITNPNIHWSKGKQQISNNLLLSLGADKLIGTNYGKGTSNRKIMLDNKWKEVYDCGQHVYEYITKIKGAY